MDTQLQIVQLCLPLLTAVDVGMLRCTCSKLRDMRVSWQEHSIKHELNGSPSAITWLHKNIVSIQDLNLELRFDAPDKLLLGLLEAGK
jgi:hypothetical protein